MAKQVRREIVLTANGKQAQGIIDALTNHMKQLQAQMKNLAAAGKSNSKEYKELSRIYKTLDKQVKENISDQQRYKKVLNDLANSSTKQLRSALNALRREMDRTSEASGKLPQMRKDMQRLQEQINKNTGAVKSQGNAWSTALRNLTAYVGMFAAFNMLKTKLTDIIKLNLKFSDQLADIRKVSGLAMRDVEGLANRLAKIDTRTTIEELNKIAYAGSKLGIGKYGVEGLESFVKASNQVNVALKEDLGEDALTALSKITEVMGLIPKMGVEKSMLATGSAMFKLSSTSTATAGNIVEFSKRLTGMARTAGITTDQLLALGSAADSMYLMPEIASTAFNKFISSLQKNHNLIEKELSITPGTINKLYSAGKTVEAMVLIFEKMRDKGNMNALQGIFKDLGSDGARLVNVMVTMSKNVDMLKEHLQTSNEAFEEATAVTQEYKIQQETAQALIERASNVWEKAFVNPRGVDNVKAMAKAWYEMSKELTSSSVYMGTFQTAISALMLSIRSLIALLPTLITFFTAKAIISAGNMFVQMAVGIWKVVTAQRALNIAMAGNIFGAIAAGLTLVIGLFFNTKKSIEEAETSMKRFKSGMDDVNKAVALAEFRLKGFRQEIDKATMGTKLRQAAIRSFNKEYGPYLSKMLTEKSTALDVANAYKEVVKQLRTKILLESREKDIKKFVEPAVGWEADKLSEYGDVQKGSKKAQYTATWLKGYIDDALDKGKTIEYIADDLANKFGVTDKIVKQQALKTRSSSNFVATTMNWRDERPGMQGRLTGRVLTKEESMLFGALRAAAQSQGLRYRQNRVNEKWKPYEDDIDKYIESMMKSEDVGTLDNKAPDKEAEKAARAAALAQAKEWRQQLKEAQSDANAIIDKVKNYYERQILEVTNKANDLNLDEAQTEALVKPIRKKMNDALAVARKAISNVEQGWDDFKSTMRDDMIEVIGENGLNESEMLLEQIEKADLQALQKKIASLSKSLDRPESALMDLIWRNATKNAQTNADAERKQREEIKKILLEHNYTGVVDDNTTQQMEKIGAFALDSEQVKTLLGGDPVKTEAMLNARSEEIASLLKNAREHIVDLYETDATTEDGRNRLLSILFGENWNQDTSQLKAIFDLYGEDMQAFYQKLIQYSDEYTEAQKKSSDERKKVNDFLWSQTDTYKDYNKEQPAQEQKSAVLGSYRNAGQKFGMSDIVSSDPELEMMKMRMEFAQKYYDFLEKHHASEKDLAEARKSIMQSQAEYAKKLTSDMFEQYNALLSFMGPLQTFGESVGDAFSTMVDDASAGRKALRDALKQMIKSFAQNTLQMLSQQQIDRANTTAHYTELLLMQELFGKAQLDAEIANGLAMTATKQSTNLTQEQLEGVHQQTMAALKSAGIFGWCVSELGPIAGPIAYSSMMAILTGLLNFAIGRIGGGSDTSSTTANANTKLVSGMLTYDSGNVQDLKPFFDRDGNMYWATEDNTAHQGVSLLTQPTATTINGQPSLVAENGPELVIGRETTKAMMQNDPQLLRTLYQYDRNHSGRHAYDNGNLASVASTTTAQSLSGNALPDNTANLALIQAVNALLVRLNEPIKASINMYGRDGLYESNKKANAFMRNR